MRLAVGFWVGVFCIFTWAQQIEIGKPEELHHEKSIGCILLLGQVVGVLQDSEWGGLDTFGRWVRFAVTVELLQWQLTSLMVREKVVCSLENCWFAQKCSQLLVCRTVSALCYLLT